MKRILPLSILLLAAGLAGKPAVAGDETKAQDGKPQIVQQVKHEEHALIGSYLGLYGFRGIDYSKGSVEQLVWASAFRTFEKDGNTDSTLTNELKIVAFMNYDNRTRYINEFDGIISYSFRPSKDIFMTASVVKFGLPHRHPDQSLEASISATLDGLPLMPSILLVKDFQGSKEEFYGFSITQPFEIAAVPFMASASTALNHGYWRVNSNMSHVGANIRADLNVTDKLILSPSATVSRSLDTRDINNQFYGQLDVKYVFETR